MRLKRWAVWVQSPPEPFNGGLVSWGRTMVGQFWTHDGAFRSHAALQIAFPDRKDQITFGSNHWREPRFKKGAN